MTDRLLRRGDSIPSHIASGLIEAATIVAIRKTPKTVRGLSRLTSLIEKRHPHISMPISAENLADNPALAKRVKPGHVYFFEK